MPALTGGEIRRLGERLRASVDAQAVTKLALFRQQYTPALLDALDVLLGLCAGSTGSLSARIKNSATIIDKLRREPQMDLRNMQDIAGIRLVVSGGRDAQDVATSALQQAGVFEQLRVIDRRTHPSSGYRAVHVFGKFQSRKMELQVRTQLQHDWAQFFERLADLYGRRIRYGAPPTPGPGASIRGVELSREDVIEEAKELAQAIADAEETGSLGREQEAYEQLRAFRDIFVRSTESDNGPPESQEMAGPGLYLAVYDRARSVTLEWQTGTAEYLQHIWTGLEERHGGDDNIEIVLLASASLEALKRTHARYFTSTPGLASP